MFDINNLFNPKFLFSILRKYWYIFLISISISYGIAYTYLKYTPNMYSTSTYIEVGDENSKGSSAFSEFAMFSELKNLDNEIRIIKSFPLILKTIESLDFNINYFVEGEIRKTELYKNSPLTIEFVDPYHEFLNQTFALKYENDKIQLLKFKSEDSYEKLIEGKSGDTLTYNRTRFILKKNLDAEYFPYLKYTFLIRSSEAIAESYLSNLRVVPVSDNSTILSLTLTGPTPERQIDFLNKLAIDYVNKDLIEKDDRANNTLQFINDQLDDVYIKLTGAENSLERFRTNKNLFDVENSTLKFSTQLDELQESQAVLNVEERYYKYLLDYVSKESNKQTIIAPSAMGVGDPLLIKIITDLNSLYAQKASLYHLENDNPTIKEINNKISSLRSTLIENVKNILKSTSIKLSDIHERVYQIEGRLSKMPKSEREYIGIKREFDLNNHIYNYLLEKRAETGIAKAAHIPENEVLEPARLSASYKISPDNNGVYTKYLFLGFLIPFIIIVLIHVVNNTVQNTKDVEDIVSIPIISEITSYKGTSNTVQVLFEKPKSILAESFRNLRINLQFLNQGKNKNQVIAFTSSISREGKTFCAINTAACLAFTHKKVLLVGADLRKPKLLDAFDHLKPNIGLSSYLTNNTSLPESIQSTSFEGLDIMLSGPIPPNPAELLENEMFESMLKTLRETYDFIVIDTSPLGLVPDYFIIEDLVDVTLFVIRQGYTKKPLLADLERISKSGKLKRTYLLLNDYDHKSSYGGKYGYGYGYGYGSVGYGYLDDDNLEKTWIQKIREKIGV